MDVLDDMERYGHINEIYGIVEMTGRVKQDNLDEVPNLNEIDNMDEMETSYLWVNLELFE